MQSPAVTRIEAVINTRPLVKLPSTDISDIPLRPVDFLQGNLAYSIPNVGLSTERDNSYDPDLIQTALQAREALEYSETVANKFWERWNTEYLTMLREIQQSELRQSRHTALRDPIVGEIVLIQQDFIPRNWSYGKIVELLRSQDGQVRSVKLQLPNRHILHRPLTKIYPLELRNTPINDNPIEEIQDNAPETAMRPLRQARVRTLQAIQEFEESLEETNTPRASQYISLGTYPLLLTLFLTIISAANATQSALHCLNGTVNITSPKEQFELCIAQSDVIKQGLAQNKYARTSKLMERYRSLSVNTQKNIQGTQDVKEPVGSIQTDDIATLCNTKEIEFTAISVHKPALPVLQRRFAISNNTVLAIPEGYKLPVECSSPANALSDFRSCANRMICACRGTNPPTRCDCPNENIQDIKADASNKLPTITPFSQTFVYDNSIVTSTQEAEVTIKIESKLLLDSGHYTLDQECQASVTNVTGCYDCQEGATISISCLTEIDAWLTIRCGAHTFPVECGAKTMQSKVILDYDRAIVEEKCTAACKGKQIEIDLAGHLEYMPKHLEAPSFETDGDFTWHQKLDWFSDIKIPDLKPLMKLVAQHWKLTLATDHGAKDRLPPSIIRTAHGIHCPEIGGTSKIIRSGARHASRPFKATLQLRLLPLRGQSRRSPHGKMLKIPRRSGKSGAGQRFGPLQQVPTTTPWPGLWSEVLHLHRGPQHAPVPVAWHIQRLQAQKDLN
ncbi:unnamed protein product [Cylicocyclus nassatus]|uniref:DUF5641 domain-containing protein n=1 Tax=Cylicocyclus nassatus TaxID=53992 RepID=A0AA36M6V2_CYLNA|nr:unnamed protein product [Cylicocyclus nassatus]